MAMETAPASADGISRRQTTIFIVVLSVAACLSFVHRFLPSVLVDAIRDGVAISDLQFSFLQTAFAVSYAVATLGSGWLADRANRRNIIVTGVVVWTIGSFMFALATDMTGLAIGRCLIGFGEALTGPASISLMCDYVRPERRGRAIAAFYFGATIGSALAFSGGGWLLERATDGAFAGLIWVETLAPWRQVVVLLSFAAAAMVPFLFAFPEPARPPISQDRSGPGPIVTLWRIRTTLALVLVTGSSIAIADFAYTTWQTALLTRTFAYSVGEAGQYIGAAALIAGVAGAWLGGAVSDWASAKAGVTGRIRVLQVSALGLLASAAILFVPAGPAAIAAYAAWQIVANIAYVAVAVTLQDIVTDRTRALAASLSTCLSIGLGLGAGPAIVAALNTSVGQGANALVPALLIFLGVLGTATLIFSTLLQQRLLQKG